MLNMVNYTAYINSNTRSLIASIIESKEGGKNELASRGYEILGNYKDEFIGCSITVIAYITISTIIEEAYIESEKLTISEWNKLQSKIVTKNKGLNNIKATLRIDKNIIDGIKNYVIMFKERLNKVVSIGDIISIMVHYCFILKDSSIAV